MEWVSRPWDFNWDVHCPRTASHSLLHWSLSCQGQHKHTVHCKVEGNARDATERARADWAVHHILYVMNVFCPHRLVLNIDLWTRSVLKVRFWHHPYAQQFFERWYDVIIRKHTYCTCSCFRDTTETPGHHSYSCQQCCSVVLECSSCRRKKRGNSSML